ncbi:T9SS type B sorting domain-containing protein [Pontibacter beigongshangensis]|uniref:T9SS type B sorting domain-containing protein n=1 Tax=Pontibacter beigongshangensis TaxID=2574733 RepID=UPI00164F1619|nr:gliding motility-associated C-terminal domain-containing protein [Pontibacter beigongshangensis]
MKTTFTPKLPFLFFFFWMLQLLTLQGLLAQGNNTVPVYNVDLTGQPNGIRKLENVDRNGRICNASNNENCVQFNITLDRNAGGLEFAIVGGPEPSGAMSYQINCGPAVPVGQPICVSGVGPHVLTLCMPGGAKNDFEIKSIAAFTPQADVSVSGGCTATLQAPIAFNEESVTWRDITGGGTYNSYLSCTSGCSAPTVTPAANAPAFVDYVVCGSSVASPCSTLPFCDTVRVYFYPPPVVSITPQPAIICPGSAGVELSGNVTGGSGNFSYLWTDSEGKLLGTTQKFLAPTVGEYFLEVRTENYPNCNKFSASVMVVTDLTVSAGPDQLVCSVNPVALAGSVTAATGGTWSGGAGTFSPDNTAMNAIYTPTAAELAAGAVTLTLTSTGNGSCLPVHDEVLIAFYDFDVALSGPAILCTGSTARITAAVTGSVGEVSYLWSTGETTASISDKPAGTYTVTVSDGNNCSIQKSFTVVEEAGPSAFTATPTSTTCGASNGALVISGVTGGTAPYSYSLDGSTFQAAATFAGLAAGNYTITVKDANGCTHTEEVVLQDIAGPSDFTAALQAATCGNSNASISISAVTGGTAPFTYSIDGTSFQTAASFSALAAATYTISVKDANGCLFSKAVVLENIPGPADFTFNAVSSTCGASNGSIAVGSVAGGAAPYTYSKDGTAFQSASTFTALTAGTYTITVRDANGCSFAHKVELNNIAGPTDLTAAAQATTCGSGNGSLTIGGVTGGTAPYTYSLDGTAFQASATFAALIAGTYTITVKDANGCTFTKAHTLTNIPGPSGFATSTLNTTCGSRNGKLTISGVNGGTAPYTYSKDGSTYQTSAAFTALVAGTYTISVKDANGCLFSKPVVVEDVAGPSDFALTASSSTCGAGNGRLTVGAITGGTAPFTYSRDGANFQASAEFSDLGAGNYTITVKDAYGCTFTRSITVNNIPGPTDLTASATATTCGASNGELTISSVTGGIAPYTYSRDGMNFQASATFTALAAGSHTVTVKDANGCTFARAFTVADIAGPTAVAATTLPASCQDNDGSIVVGTVTGGTAPYTYSINGTDFQAGTAFAALAAGTYTVTARDANGCLTTSSVTVTRNVPTAFASTTASSTCGASNGSIRVRAVTGGTAPYTYSKDGTSFQTSSTLSGLAAGTHTITVRDAKGCTFSRSITVNNIPGPTDLAASATATTCGASNGALTISAVTGGTAPYTYSKDGVNFQASATFAVLAAGTHNITVKDVNGCTFARAFTVTDIAGPTAVAATTLPASCQDNDGSIAVGAVTGGTAPFTYSINGTDFQAGTAFAALASGAYTVTAKDANGCVVATSVVIGPDVPTAFASTVAASTCGNSNGNIIVGTVTGGTAPYTYSKDGTSFQASATLTGFAAGIHTITVRDAKGCTFAAQVEVTDIAGPSGLTASVKSSTCGSSNGEITVNAVSEGTSPYTYSINGTSYQASATFASVLAGEYQVSVRDANGCVYTETVQVQDITGPSFTSTVQSSTCGNSNGQVAVAVTGGTAPFTYSRDGVNYQSAATFTNLLAGVYTITVKDANGCLATAAVSIGDVPGPRDIVLTTTSSTCGSSNGSISAGTVTGGAAPYTFSRDGMNFQSSATFSNLIAGTFSITVKDVNGCTFTKAVTLDDMAGPTDLLISVKASTCGNSNGEFTISGITGGSAPYTYSIDGTTFQASSSFTALAADTYRVTVKDVNGCTFVKQVVVNDIAGPSNFTATMQATSCGRNNGSIRLTAVAGGTAPYTYSSNGTTFQTSANFTNLAAGTHTITVKDANGCMFTKGVVLEDIAGPSYLSLSSVSSTCGNSNGSITVGGVTGGTAPYTYAIDGTTFQSATTFRSVPAGEYTITVKDASGCTFVKTVTVDDLAGPTNLTASATSSTCGASNGALTLTAVTGGAAPYTYSKDGVNFQTSPTFAVLATGTHNITVKDSNGCTFARAFTVTDIAGPTAVAATTLPASCQDNDGSIMIGGVTGGTAPYTYSINGTDFQNETAFTSLSAGTHTVTARDANGCEVTRSVTVAANVPTAFASSTISSTCGDSNGSITVGKITGGTAPYTYSVDGTTFRVSSTIAGLAAGTHTITVKDARGCIFARQVILNNINGPTELAATVKATTCGSSNGSLTISGITGGTAPYTYSLDGTTFLSSATFAALSAGTYSITVKDANGCVYTQAVAVGDIAGPAAVALLPQSATCGGRNGALTVSGVTGGTAPYTYSIDGTNFQGPATFSALAAGTYTITVKDANGCTVTGSIDVEDITGPTDLAWISKPSTCGSSDGTISIGEVTGGTAPFTFSLDGTAFQGGSGFGSVRAGEYSITVKDANGCTFAKKVVVENVGGPNALSASTTSSICGASNGGLSITAVSGGVAPYTYSKDGVNFQGSTSFTGLAAGTHTITVQDANGCTFTRSFTVSDVPGPTTVAASSVPASCADNDGSLTVTSVSGGTAPYTYSINGSGFQAGGSFAALASGAYTITARDDNGCEITGSFTIEKVGPASFSSSTVASTCGRSDGQLTINHVGGGTAPYTYSMDDGAFQVPATFTELAAGTYNITVKDANGCVYSQAVAVSNIDGPIFSAAASASTCGGGNGSIAVSGVSGGVGPYSYSKDGKNFQSALSFDNLLAGTYIITVRDANGCLSTETVVLEDIAGPSAFVVAPQAATCGAPNGQVMISDIVGGTAPFSYSSNGTAFQASPVFEALAAGAYTLTVKDANGCVVSRSIAVGNIAGPAELVLTSMSSTCGESNGSISVGGVTGGTAPYVFALDGVNFQPATTFGEVLAGEHTVTVRDASGCTFAKTVRVDDVAGPSDLAASAVSTTCGASNGELTISGVTGGTAPYTFSQDGVNFQASATFTALTAGQHTITVKDANGCTFVKAFMVTNIAGPTAVAATTVAASCQDNDGSIMIGGVTGGTAPYTYSINGTDFQNETAFTSLSAGTHTVTARDANGCEVTASVTVTTDVPTVFVSTTASSTCGNSNGSITVATVTGGTAPYTYSLDGSIFQTTATFAALAVGSHTITVKDAKGCVFTAQVQVSDIGGPSGLTASVETSTCGGSNGELAITAVTGGTAPFTYSLNGIDFQTSATFLALAAGSYTITVRDANGCEVTERVELENITGPSDFVLSPQSSTCGHSNGQINISDVTGGTAPFTYSKDGTNFQAAASFDDLIAGTYTITIKDANGCIVSREVEVQDIGGPDNLNLTSTASTCGSSDGSISIAEASGGTAPYTFALDGTTFQSATAFEAVLAGEYTVTVRDANGCTFAKKVVVENLGGPNAISASTTSSICGASNGGLTVTAITGGAAPYTYSEDGVNFQASTSFTGLTSGIHTITVKDANGCTFAKAFMVTNIAGPTAVAATTVEASCQDNDGSITVGAVTGGMAPYTYSINGEDFQTGTAFAALASGAFTITVKDANGCLATTSVTINQSVPTAITTARVATTCGRSNGEITVRGVSGGTAPYTYSKDDTSFQTEPAFSELAAGTYTITVKDARGCTYAVQVQVGDVDGVEGLSASVGAATCNKSNGSILISEVSGGTAPYTYSLNGAGFQSAASFTALNAGTYAVTVRDAYGCLYTEEAVVPATAGPTDFVLTPQSATCVESSGTVVVSEVAGGTGPYTYSKDGTNFQASATLTGLAAGNHSITVKDASGCTFAKTVVVEQLAGPENFDVAAVQASCGDSNGSISASSIAGGTAPYSFSLDGVTFQVAATFDGLAAGAYTITVKDANGCTFAKEVNLAEQSGVTEIATATTPAACTDNGTIMVSAVTGGIAPYTYSLDGSNYQASATFTALAPQEYTVFVKDANGCTTSIAVSVEGNSPMEATLASVPAGCVQRNGSITVESVTGGVQPYTYSLNGADFQTGTLFANLAAGSYIITIRDAEGCEITQSQEVSSSGGAESFTVAGTNASCGGNNGRLEISEVSGGRSPYTYSLNGTSFQATPLFTGLAAGDYQVTVKDAAGCVLVKTESIGSSPAIANLNVRVEPVGCGQNAGELVIEEVSGGTAPFQYSLDGVNFSSATAFSGLAVGNYTLTVKDARNCTHTVAVSIGEVASAIASVRHVSCAGEANGAITISARGDNEETAYSIDNGLTFQQSPVFGNLAGGVYQVVTRFSPTCTVAVGTVTVKEPEPLQVEVTPLTKTFEDDNLGSAAVTAISGGAAPYTYQLNNGKYAADSVFDNLPVGTHALLVKDSRGCITEVYFTIETITEIEIPNGFTPNGDGINDLWVLKNLPVLYPGCKVTVYNRWGSPVFESVGYKKAWDGTHNGKKLPVGTYYCIIELGNAEPPLKKSVTIMR